MRKHPSFRARGRPASAALVTADLSWNSAPPGSLPGRTARPPRAPGALARPQPLHEIFEKRADLCPGALAVVSAGERLTYLELEERANRLARHLRARGVGRGSRAAVLLPRSPDAYAALLGILKAGAAYVPLDPEYPVDRVAFILRDCEAEVLVTTASLASQHPRFGGALVSLDADAAAIAAESHARLAPGEVGNGPRDLCYIIYTSGSTGRPKGVMVEHRSACHLVHAEGELFQVRPEDRVYQGFSLAFDASVEEIWLAFRAGATLVAATCETAGAGPDLSRHLAQSRVTVFSTVPSLLSVLTEPIPTLRLLILGGEKCPAPLVERWARPGLRMVNTYGPTEATVIATYADLAAGKPVTIGRAVPGYRVVLVDDRMEPVPPGAVGEICIGGPGVARGYVGLPEETRARFVPDRFAPADEPGARMYRTGDLGRIDGEGNLEFVGRSDAQVKLRGFRVELGEIESVLLEGEGVQAAACSVREDLPGGPLVGYVVSSNGPIDEGRLRSHLRSRLPAFMVPALIEPVDALPRLSSGKLDRAALPAPRLREKQPPTSAGAPRGEVETRIAAVWEALFPSLAISRDDHFFLDLGGHSLLAARAVSELRKDARFARLSVIDLYRHPTLAALAAALGGEGQHAPRPLAPELDRAAPPAPQTRVAAAPRASEGARSSEPGRHFAAGILQAAGLYFSFGVRGLQWVTPYLVCYLLLAGGRPLLESVAWGAVSAMAVLPLILAAAVLAKWVMLGRIRAGRHPLWGGYYLRFWFVRTLVSSLPLELFCGTPLLPMVYRLFGARIGRDVHMETDRLIAFDLISIGDGTSIDDSASLLGSAVERGELVLGPVEIGRGCFVGTGSVVRERTVMEDGARLEDLSLLPSGGRIPRGETWVGSPARPAASPGPELPPPPVHGPLRRAATAALYGALILTLPALALAAFVPGVVILSRIDPLAQPLLYLATLPLVGASFVLLLTAGVTLFKWLLVGRVRAGTYPVDGWFYLREWMVGQLMAISLDVVGALHATLYLGPWYRALGARLGRWVELSTATAAVPDLLEIGEGATIADEVSLGAPRVEGGWMTLAPTRLGRRTFVGNGAVVPAGTVLGEGSLVGVLSVPPSDPGEAARPGASWLGSPALGLPRREPSAVFPEQRTFRPTRRLWLTRGAIEILRVTLPPAGFVIVTTTVVTAALALRDRVGLGLALPLLPAVYAAACVSVALGVVALKWLVIGRYQPFERPLWNPAIWRLEFVNALYEFLVSPLLLEPLQGTPFLPWYLRLLGARIGRRTYLHTTGFLEWDLVEIGDEAMVNEDCVLQTHLFEDRVLKAARLRIGRGCEVGALSVVLYDTEMGEGTRLEALSLLMKGETLPAGTSWIGVPAAWRAPAGPGCKARSVPLRLNGTAPRPETNGSARELVT